LSKKSPITNRVAIPGRPLSLYSGAISPSSRPDSDVDLALALMPPKGKHDWALGNYFALESEWKRQLEEIVGRQAVCNRSCRIATSLG
jgi:hypothetical protein